MLIVVLLWVEGGVLLVELVGTEGAVVVWFSVGLGVKRGEEGFVDEVLVVLDRSGHGLVHGIVDREGFDLKSSPIAAACQSMPHAALMQIQHFELCIIP